MLARPGRKPTNAPPGTMGLDQSPVTGGDRNLIHRIKENLKGDGIGAGSYVGISPDGDIIVTNSDGSAANLGHHSQYSD